MRADLLPNPGSNAALEMGCTCPVLDNAHGREDITGGYFWISELCPLHKQSTASDAREGGEE